MGAAASGLSFAEVLVKGCGPPPTDQVLSWPEVERALAGNGKFTISTGALVAPDAFAGDYSSWLQAVNATGPLSWSLNAGALPPGFKLATNGHLTGPASSLTGSFDFSVRLSETGPSAQSTTRSLTLGFVPDGIPAAPSNIVATAADGAATVHWSVAAARGGPAVESYAVVELYSGPHGCSASGPLATSCVVHGLTNGEPYVFSVSATNAVGTSADAVASNVVWPAVAQAAPLTRPSIRVASTRLRVRSRTRTVPVRIQCTLASCVGVLRLSELVPISPPTAASASAGGALKTTPLERSVLLATAEYRLPRGGHEKVELALTASGIARLTSVAPASPIRAEITVSVAHGRALRTAVELR